MTKQPPIIIGARMNWGDVIRVNDQQTADRLGVGALFRGFVYDFTPPMVMPVEAMEDRIDVRYVRNSGGSLSLTERGVREWRRPQ